MIEMIGDPLEVLLGCHRLVSSSFMIANVLLRATFFEYCLNASKVNDGIVASPPHSKRALSVLKSPQRSKERSVVKQSANGPCLSLFNVRAHPIFVSLRV